MIDKTPPPSLTQLKAYGENLTHIIEALPFSAHLRDIETDRFLIANQYQATNNGFKEIKEVINITPIDLYYQHKRLLSQLGASLNKGDEYNRLFEKANYRVQHLKTPVNFREYAIFKEGFIYLGINTKIPVLGENEKVLAVFTCSKEITSQTDLFYLYHLYKTCYCSERLAIQYFLRYLEVDNYFSVMPTNSELLALLALRQASTYKLASKLLHTKNGIFIKSGTLGVHLQNLRKKLKERQSLDSLLMSLREDKKEPAF